MGKVIEWKLKWVESIHLSLAERGWSLSKRARFTDQTAFWETGRGKGEISLTHKEAVTTLNVTNCPQMMMEFP